MKAEPLERWLQPQRLYMPLFAGLVIVVPAWAFAQASGSASLDPAVPSFLLPTLALVVLTILLNALFVAADTAIELLRSAHVRSAQGERDTKRLQELIDHRPRYVAACTLGTQTMMGWQMALAFIPAPGLAHAWDVSRGVTTQWWHVFLVGVLLTLPVAALNLVFGILIPKSIAALAPSRYALMTFGPVRAFSLFFSVPVTILTSVANLIVNRFGAQASFLLPRQAEEEIRNLVDTAQETGAIEEEEKELLHSVFEFGDTVAREVMTPRVDMDAAPIDVDVDALIAMIQESGHSRIPLYEDTDDQIIGIIHAKDLLAARRDLSRPVDLVAIKREVLFIPENKPLPDLLRELKKERTQMAIVQDEFGGTAGLVTIEDIVEELVGDIVDEYDEETAEIVPNGTGWRVDGRTNLYDLNSEIGSTFESEEFDTIGGYVFGLFGRQPKVGETLDESGYRFRIEETDGRKIGVVHVERLLEDSLLDVILSEA